MAIRKLPDYNYFWKNDRWFGGESEDSRIGNAGAFRYGIGWDIRDDSGLLKAARKPVRIDNGEILHDIKCIEPHPTNGDVYYYAFDTVYKRSAGVISAVLQMTFDQPNGQGIIDWADYLYIRTQTAIHRYRYANGGINFNYVEGLEVEDDISVMCRFKNLLLIPHGRYICSIDDVGTVNTQRIAVPPGYKVRQIFEAGGYAVILVIRGQSVTDSEQGLMLLWNGTSETYDDYLPLTGNPQAGAAINNKIVVITGAEPVIQESIGGAATPQMGIPDVGIGKTALINPTCIDVFRNLIHFGISGGTSDTVLRVVRNWGAKNAKFPTVLNPEYPPSHGNITGQAYQITALKRIGTTIQFSWNKNGVIGIDQVDMNQYQTSSVLRTLAFDRNSPYEKVAYRLMVELSEDLKTGESVSVKLGVDPYDDAAFADATKYESMTLSTVGERLLELPLEVSVVPIRSRDLHIEFSQGNNGSTTPVIKRAWVAMTESLDQM